ncbi:uncharacterized protein PHACADRAFT_174941 [Phanerochaete carnosa HHB-10118-sp]|uniref:Cysteine proteinase 1, mitochondrial n=1 Tax=Phanerochaete carnosa (strain HHB-10118-sp) TaxID=650164 RepID=K5UWL5_PHACS|nr:uncharacterized protein PHACADRAFT_174941 [Phanerochaete carnosa HHB-10118-sp]EKM54436.1 hypothetical protein PHACADRAFT_174941 [Phanerochaete carnosa HHB-10118-sp]
MGSAPSKPASPAAERDVSEKQSAQDVTESLSSLRVSDPASADGSLSVSSLLQWEQQIAETPSVELARTILNHADLKQTLLNRKTVVTDQHVFNTELKFKTGPITNQKSSGRCWLFATTNVLRYNIMKKFNLEEFQLSQSYLFFYDKLNKANYFLELMIEHADLPLEDRLVKHLSSSGSIISDGGQWDMAVNLLETYGIVPQAVYPESFSSSLSAPLNTLLKTKLREHALILRALHQSLLRAGHDGAAAASAARAKKEELMKEVYTIMTAALGVPPLPRAHGQSEPFVWDYYDKDGKPGHWEGTPQEFYAIAKGEHSPKDSFSLIHDPRNAFGKLYTVDKLGNIWGARPVLYVNTKIDDLKQAVVKMIQAGVPVFFGCDVGQSSERNLGIMDTKLYEFERAFGIKLGLSKADRLQTGESAMTHAMVISGVHVDPSSGKPVRYQVENSWGEDPGNKGYFIMTDEWFDEYVFQVVVPKALAPKELVKVFESDDKVVLPAWDPMGALA